MFPLKSWRHRRYCRRLSLLTLVPLPEEEEELGWERGLHSLFVAEATPGVPLGGGVGLTVGIEFWGWRNGRESQNSEFLLMVPMLSMSTS